MTKKILPALLSAQLLLSCSSGGSDSDSCTTLTAQYLQQKLSGNPRYEGVNFLEAKLIHDDGDQGADYDIDRIVLTRVSYDTLGDTLALSYGGYGGQPDFVLHAALYIDVDSDASTGQIVDDIGADILLVDAIVFDISHPSPVYSWDNTGALWISRTGPLTDSGGNYQSRCGYGVRYLMAWSSVLASDQLDLSQARGIMKLLTYDNNDPNNGLISQTDTTGSFTFSFP
jgi:hypothetical protein